MRTCTMVVLHESFQYTTYFCYSDVMFSFVPGEWILTHMVVS
jgi:hypothetical protein